MKKMPCFPFFAVLLLSSCSFAGPMKSSVPSSEPQSIPSVSIPSSSSEEEQGGDFLFDASSQKEKQADGSYILAATDSAGNRLRVCSKNADGKGLFDGGTKHVIYSLDPISGLSSFRLDANYSTHEFSGVLVTSSNPLNERCLDEEGYADMAINSDLTHDRYISFEGEAEHMDHAYFCLFVDAEPISDEQHPVPADLAYVSMKISSAHHEVPKPTGKRFEKIEGLDEFSKSLFGFEFPILNRAGVFFSRSNEEDFHFSFCSTSFDMEGFKKELLKLGFEPWIDPREDQDQPSGWLYDDHRPGYRLPMLSLGLMDVRGGIGRYGCYMGLDNISVERAEWPSDLIARVMGQEAADSIPPIPVDFTSDFHFYAESDHSVVVKAHYEPLDEWGSMLPKHGFDYVNELWLKGYRLDLRSAGSVTAGRIGPYANLATDLTIDLIPYNGEFEFWMGTLDLETEFPMDQWVGVFSPAIEAKDVLRPSSPLGKRYAYTYSEPQDYYGDGYLSSYLNLTIYDYDPDAFLAFRHEVETSKEMGYDPWHQISIGFNVKAPIASIIVGMNSYARDDVTSFIEAAKSYGEADGISMDGFTSAFVSAFPEFVKGKDNACDYNGFHLKGMGEEEFAKGLGLEYFAPFDIYYITLGGVKYSISIQETWSGIVLDSVLYEEWNPFDAITDNPTPKLNQIAGLIDVDPSLLLIPEAEWYGWIEDFPDRIYCIHPDEWELQRIREEYVAALREAGFEKDPRRWDSFYRKLGENRYLRARIDSDMMWCFGIDFEVSSVGPYAGLVDASSFLYAKKFLDDAKFPFEGVKYYVEENAEMGMFFISTTDGYLGEEAYDWLRRALWKPIYDASDWLEKDLDGLHYEVNAYSLRVEVTALDNPEG